MATNRLREIYNFIKSQKDAISYEEMNDDLRFFLSNVRKTAEQYQQPSVQFFESDVFDDNESIIIEDDVFPVSEGGYVTSDEFEFVIRINSTNEYKAIFFSLYGDSVRIDDWIDHDDEFSELMRPQ